MRWEDQGFLLSKNRYSENSVIAEFFTKNHGKVSGMIFGATSKKIKNYLQLGNKFYINFNSKNVTLGSVLSELMLALKNLTVPTGVGPSGIPINLSAFEAVNQKLKQMLKQ